MSAVTASTLIIEAYELIGVVQPGETPDAILMQRGLSRLNRMLGQWSIQSLTMPVIARELFGLTANVGTYSIGPGGNFDTTRPPWLTGAALLLNSNSTAVAVTSITRSGSVATVTTPAAHGAAQGQNVTIAGATPAPFNGTFPIASVPTTTSFTYVFQGATASASGTITALFESTATDVTEIPIPVITDDSEQAIQIKSLTSALFSYLYYQATFWGGLGQIKLWPVPTTGDNTLVLYRPQQLSSFTNLAQQYWLPEGADEAIEYNLAVRLCAPNGVAVPQDVAELARTSLGTYKRSNIKLSDLPLDQMWTMARRGGYNIITGSTTGGGR